MRKDYAMNVIRLKRPIVALLRNQKDYAKYRDVIRNSTFGTYIKVDGEETEESVYYFVPIIVYSVQEQSRRLSREEQIEYAFPVSRSFLSSIDWNYIDEEGDKEYLRNELQRYDDQARGITSTAADNYIKGRIPKQTYAKLRNQLHSVEQEAYRVEQEYILGGRHR